MAHKGRTYEVVQAPTLHSLTHNSRKEREDPFARSEWERYKYRGEEWIKNDNGEYVNVLKRGTVYVPSSLVSNYSTKTNWNILGCDFKAIEDLPAFNENWLFLKIMI